MYCPNCGTKNPDDAKFCENCGAPMNAGQSSSGQTTQQASTSSAQQAAASQPPQQQNYQQSYAPPPPPPQSYQQPQSYASGAAQAPVMTVGQYIGTFIVLGLPLIGFIFMLVWAFGGDSNPNRKNLCRAALILALIGIVLGIVFGVLLGGVISNLFNSYSYY